MTIHHTMGVYPSGDRKHNGVSCEHLGRHIQYNLQMRPGRAFFLDGYCLNTGGVGQERCDAIEKELADNPVVMPACTLPYR